MYGIVLYLFHLMGCISLNEALFGLYVDAWILVLFLIARKLHDKYILDSSGDEELSETEGAGNPKGKREGSRQRRV